MTGTILGIIGITITIAFGIYAIWTYKKSKRNISLEFQNKECYSLFRNDVNRLNIELSYNKKPLSNTLILLKAKLINNGKIDIDKNRIYSPLKIISTQEYKWLESTITSQPNGASTSIQLKSDNKIQIDWDLLKKEEFVEIEALAEIVDGDNPDGEKAIDFYNGLTFDFRITDLNSIQKEKQVSAMEKRKNSLTKQAKFGGIGAILLGSLFLLFYFVPELIFMPEKHIIEYFITDGTHEKIGSVKSTKQNEVNVTFTETEEKIELSVDDFNKLYKIQQIKRLTIDPKSRMFYLYLGITYIILGGILFILLLSLKRQ